MKVISRFSVILITLVILAFLFELAFQKVTGGISFFSKYFQEQIFKRSFSNSSDIFIWGRLKSFGYYLSRLVFYSAPFSFGLIYLAFLKKSRSLKNLLKKVLSSPMLMIIVMYLLVFSTSTRLASRYIYPAYFLLATYAIIEILKVIKLRQFQEKTMYFLTCLVFGVLALSNILVNADNHLKYAY